MDDNEATPTGNGIWSYGDLGAGQSATRTWRMRNPDALPYIFRGNVFTVASPGPSFYASGSGHGWAAQFQNLYLDSNGTALTVTLKLHPIDGMNNNVWILVDDTSQATGESDLTTDLTSWGSLGLANAVAANVDFAYSGSRGNGGLAANRAARRWVSGVGTDVASSLVISQDDATGTYAFTIPYASIGSGSAAGNAVRVYALYGLNASSGGIHSAAPEQSPTQVVLMNNTGASGLTSLDTAAPTYFLK